MVYRLPPVLSRLSVPSCATRSIFQFCPNRFLVSPRTVCLTFPSRPYRFSASSRAVRPTFPFVPPVLRCVVRYSFGVSSRPSRLPFCPVSRLLHSPFFLSFAGYYCTRPTTLLFGGLLANRHTRVWFNPFTLFMCVCTFVIIPN